ncbi:MAG: cyclic nucleotide-binding domain-containing protein [Anaerolineae bacterium]
MSQPVGGLDAGSQPARQPRNLWTWVRAQVDKASYRPQSAPEVITRQLVEDGHVYYVLKNPRQVAYLRLSQEDYSLWELMDGSHTVKDLVVAYFQRHQSFAFGRVMALVDELRAGGFLTDKPVGLYRQVRQQLAERDWSHRWQRLAHALVEQEFYLDGIDRFVRLLYRLGGRVFFFGPVLALLTLLALIGLIAFVSLLGQPTYALLAPPDSSIPGYIASLLTLLLINLVMIFFHEMAHALSTRHFGREIRRGGFMIYYGMPAFFVDTVDIWLEPKRRRIAVTWAGLHADLVTAGVCSLLAFWIGDSTSLVGTLLFRAAFLGYFSVFLNLNPLLELDGYFILSDWLGIPMLRQRSFAFLREELPGRVSAWLRLRQPDSPAAGPGAGTSEEGGFSREEIIFAVFGVLSALYTIYAFWLALYFWQTRISKLLLDLWNKDPALIFKPLVALVVTLLIVPLTLAAGAILWNAVRRLADWLERRHFFEREYHVALVVVAGLAVLLGLPALWQGTSRQVMVTAASVLLAGLAVWTLVLTARQYAGAEFQVTFWGLALAASLLLLSLLLRGLYLALADWSSHELVGEATGLAGQLAAIGLLAAGVGSLLGLDLRRGPVWERVVIIGLLALGFIVVLPVARWTAGWPLIRAIPFVAAPYFTLVSLALILPTVAAYAGTQFFTAWITLASGAGMLGILNAARTAPSWSVETVSDGWLALAVAALWGAGGLVCATAGNRLRLYGPHWSYSLAYSESERLRTAFARFFETLLRGFRTAFGARRAQMVDDELDILAVTADWDVEVDAGRVRDKLDLSQLDILEQADRYREVLRQAIDLIDDWAGNMFTARLAQVAYDSLPWPERETLGRYVLAGTRWGGAIADQFSAARSERDRLLRGVPLFAGLRDHEFYLLQAALVYEKVAAGRTLARRGTPIHRFVLIQSGEVEVWRPGPNRQVEQLTGELRRGASFGAEALAGQDARYEATYRASVECEILTITEEAAAHLRQIGVEFGKRVTGNLSRVQLLGEMPIFAALSPQQINTVARHMRLARVPAGEIIIRQGEPRHDFYVIVQGQVAVCARDETGREKIVARLGRGEHFGETALYTDRPYAATCRAETAVELLALDEAAFDQLVASSGQMAYYVEQISSGRTIETRRKLAIGRQ